MLIARELNADLRVLHAVGQYRNTIAAVAQDWDADLIILGSHRTRFGDGFVGTTAERIIRKAHRPVLVVNREVAGPYERVLLTSDLSGGSAGAARVAQDLGLLDAGSASVVHSLSAAGSSLLRMSGVSEPSIETYKRQMSRSTSSEIREQLGNAGLRTDGLSVLAQEATPLRAIESMALHMDADLVVVGASRFPRLKRIVLGSISNEVLRRLACDVLLVSPGAIKRARALATIQKPAVH